MAVPANFLIFSLGVAFLLFGGADAGKRMVCYYGGWSPYRAGEGQFQIENIDPNLCTHAIYGFAGLGDNGLIRVFDPWQDLPDDWGKDGYNRFNKMRNVNPGLKTLIAIGGWNEGSTRYSAAFKTAAGRTAFVQDVANFVARYGFNGLDLDWEYPGQRGGDPIDKYDFTALIKELRAEFDRRGFLLTAAVAAAEFSFTQSYEVPELVKYLDFINVMTYDYHGAWENVTGHNAPLKGSAVEIGTEFEGFSIEASIQAWLRYGADPAKLNMGVGLYGRAFTLASTSCVATRCPTSGAGKAGPSTAEAGMLGYNEICKYEATGVQYWDEEQQSPYLVFDTNQWVGYDNERTADLKVKFINDNNLGGAMVWSIDTDDFRGLCGKGKYPILSILKRGMDNSAPSTGTTTTAAAAPTTTTTAATAAPTTTTTAATAAPTTTTTAATAAPTTTTTAATTTAASTPDQPCQKEGYNRDSTNCAVFYQCSLISAGNYKYTKFTCSNGLLFDTTQNVCNFADQVDCS